MPLGKWKQNFLPVQVSPCRVAELDASRSVTKRRLAQESVTQLLTILAEWAVGLGREQSGIDLQVLLHGEELHTVDLLLYVQLDGQRRVAEHITGTQREVMPTYTKQYDVVDSRKSRLLWRTERHPDGERLGHNRVCKFQLQHAALQWTLRRYQAHLHAIVGAPGTNTWLTYLLHIWWTWETKETNWLFIHV